MRKKSANRASEDSKSENSIQHICRMEASQEGTIQEWSIFDDFSYCF